MIFKRGLCAPLQGVSMGRAGHAVRIWHSAAALAVALAGSLSAADANLTVLKGFRYPEYDDQGRLKMEVAGDEAHAESVDLIRIKNLHMVFYEEKPGHHRN